MRIFITGATGLLGRRLVIDRLERGDQVVLLSRDAARAERLFAANANRNITVVAGDPAVPGVWQNAVAGCDAAIHLAGAGIADHRWTKAYKRRLVSSRVETTHQVVQAIAQAPPAVRPRVLINGSAIGYYGDGGERELDEDAPPGTDFLSRLCTEWEAQALRAQAIGPDAVRVVLLRTAVVLDDRGGALPQMARPFRLGVGGRIGSGRQWMSWIHWRDLVGLIDHAIEDADISGPLNAASPQPMRNADFARAMGRSIGRPSWLPAPKFALRIALGEVAGALTNSQRVIPAKALDSGYVFLYPGLEQALQSLLGRDDDRGKASFFNSKDLHPGPAVLKTSAPAEPVNELPLPFVPARPVQLVAIDVDGTLLNTDGSIPQGVIHACRAAERAGCKIMLATARAPRALRTILQALDIPGPSINYNGAVIWDHERNAALFHEAVPAALARRIINDVQAMAPELIIGLDVLDRWHVTRVDPLFAMTNDPEYQPDSVGSLEPYLGDPVTKISLMGTPDQLLPVREMIRERYWQLRHVAVFLPDPRLVQITHPLVDKGIALQRVARQMGLSREEVMAIGDASNDMGMIEWAGVGVAVENAYPAVRQLADVIVPSNDELGVARAIQRYVLAGRR